MTTLPEETAARDPESPVDTDVVVVGGGAAGLSAAVFLARYGLETLVLARGKSAIDQCAHLENYLGFPGGISPERFLALGEAHAEHEGATVEATLVEHVERHEVGFRVETQNEDAYRTQYVLVASAYDGSYLDPLAPASDDDEGFLLTDDGRTSVDGLYAAGWLTRDTVHQPIVNAGDGARTAITLARDDLSERYWPEIGERYVDWVVDENRYGGEGWHDDVDDWFDREIAPGAPAEMDEAAIDAVRAELKSAYLDRGLPAGERECRERVGQRLVLEAFDDDVILAYAAELTTDHHRPEDLARDG
jgi:choline dehydrogenase-like flavoprotein